MSKSKRPKVRRTDLSHRTSQLAGPKTIRVVELEVTFDPIPAPQIAALPQEWQDRLDTVMTTPMNDRSSYIPLLEEATAFAPHIPILWNFLTVAYNDAGRTDDAERLVLEIHKRFPNYLIGTVNYCRLLSQKHRAPEVPQALGGDFDLTRIAGRRSFHYTELINFYVMVAEYHSELANFELAEEVLDSLAEMVGENEQIDAAYSRILFARLKHSLGRFIPGSRSKRRTLQ